MIWLLLLLTAPAGTFHQCGLTGTAQPARVRALNVLKNRSVQPHRINAAITAAAIAAPGQDLTRFSADDGAVIRLFVTRVKVGGIESVNCGATAAQWRDTHIEGNAVGAHYGGQPIIVEVTPRWRAAAQLAGDDWSTHGLQTLVGHWVTFTGWIFVDGEHTQNAQNTNPTGRALWRQTVVELHPVTLIAVEP